MSNRFNTYMNSHFSSCRLIARAYDKCRNRSVQLYAMPGHYDCVGVTDGTDAWIAPASAGLFFGTATGNCADIMRRLATGEELPPVPDAPSAPRTRVRLNADAAPVSPPAPATPERNHRVRL